MCMEASYIPNGNIANILDIARLINAICHLPHATCHMPYLLSSLHIYSFNPLICIAVAAALLQLHTSCSICYDNNHTLYDTTKANVAAMWCLSACG